MVAVDSSSFIAFLQGEEGADVDAVDHALGTKQAILPPVVVAELLSDPKMEKRIKALILDLPNLEIVEGYWIRAGETRAKILSKGIRARLADTLISQSCLDHKTPLIARDTDFQNFVKYAGLELIRL